MQGSAFNPFITASSVAGFGPFPSRCNRRVCMFGISFCNVIGNVDE